MTLSKKRYESSPKRAILKMRRSRWRLRLQQFVTACLMKFQPGRLQRRNAGSLANRMTDATPLNTREPAGWF